VRAKMTILNLCIPNSEITPYGGGPSNQSPAGHSFQFRFNVKVTPRPKSPFARKGIDCPELEWLERIEWFAYNQRIGWYFVGATEENGYRVKPNSNTYKEWHTGRFFLAFDQSNNPPEGLAGMTDNKAAEEWIARNGYTWTLKLRDIPGMGITAGSAGGMGASLVTGDTRRRVIYFNLGFWRTYARARAVQILEAQDGALTIHKFINQDVPKSLVDDPANLDRWRAEVNNPSNYNFY